MTSPTAARGLDVAAVRDHFPSLKRTVGGHPVAYLDGPGGTQVPSTCIDAIGDYLRTSNANLGGPFAASTESGTLVDEAHAATGDFLGGVEPGEVIFGPNMTTLTFAVSRAIGRGLQPGDELVVSRLDHDANVAPWLALAAERDLRVRWLEVNPEDCTLQLGDLDSVITERTRLVAVGLASNAVGTVNDVRRIGRAAHAQDALLFVDAVHAAPHLPIAPRDLGADLLACSPYKFFGPHLGVLYGRRDLLERLVAYRVRPAGEGLPGKWETGTQPHELLAGLLGTYEYLASLGRAYGGASPADGRAAALRAALAAIGTYERQLIGPLLEGLAAVPGCTVHGITSPERFDERVPTVSFRLDGVPPRRIAAHLAGRGISVWDGDYYAFELVGALGLRDAGGMVRVGLVHYNTSDEVERLLAALGELAPG
jgi:cysteine desulfurase family protein (TIGR01976 family)